MKSIKEIDNKIVELRTEEESITETINGMELELKEHRAEPDNGYLPELKRYISMEKRDRIAVKGMISLLEWVKD